MEQIDMGRIDACVGRALELLRRTYRTGPGRVGGWYHNLDSDAPGPSATSVGLSSFLISGEPFEHRDECLAFLHSRQVRSRNPVLDGGWAVNTSFGQPVTEATALVARLLVVTRVMFAPGAPDAARACRWLVRNQNDDGGWGSFSGQESRIWLTAMATRALSELNPGSPELSRGTRWLVSSRDPASRAWGERPGQRPTVTHTSFVLSALVDSGVGAGERSVADAIAAGYDWLTSHLRPGSVHDDDARVETYNVTRATSDGKAMTWQSTVWHQGLPYAVSALVRQPGVGWSDLLGAAVRTIVASQYPEGRWPSSESVASVSVWTVWPFLEALSEVARSTPVRGRDLLTWISPSTFVVRRGADRSTALPYLLWRTYRRVWQRWLGRWWAAVVLVSSVALGLLLVLAAEISLAQFLTALAIPVLLLVIQEAMSRNRPGR